ncbi:SETMR methyltransferase, partial [Acromyrmex insinuator]
MEINKEKIRYILQYYYNKGKNAAQAYEKICVIYDEDTLSKSAARKWFAHFRIGNFDVKDEPRSDRPITEKSDEIMKRVERDKHVTTMEIARELGIDHKTVLNHLHKAGCLQKSLNGGRFKRFRTSGSESRASYIKGHNKDIIVSGSQPPAPGPAALAVAPQEKHVGKEVRRRQSPNSRGYRMRKADDEATEDVEATEVTEGVEMPRLKKSIHFN